jgi:hypothetical protein
MKYEGRLVAREWPQRTTRIAVGYDVVVRSPDGDIAAEVLNISSKGFRLHCERPLDEGWEITVDMPGTAPVKAVIRWVAGNDAGGMFAEAVGV